MKIVTVCDQGNNRSVQFAHLLKYKYKADVISVGLNTTSEETKTMLFEWATYIIVTDEILLSSIPGQYKVKVKLWDVGSDKQYPRPFNPQLLEIAKRIIENNPLV